MMCLNQVYFEQIVCYWCEPKWPAPSKKDKRHSCLLSAVTESAAHYQKLWPNFANSGRYTEAKTSPRYLNFLKQLNNVLSRVLVYIFVSVSPHSQTLCVGRLQFWMNWIENKMTTACHIASCPKQNKSAIYSTLHHIFPSLGQSDQSNRC